MSRRFLHEYTLPCRQDDVDAAIDALVKAVEASMPPSCYGVGRGDVGTGRVSYTFVSNRARGRRIVSDLNDRLGVVGLVDVTLSSEYLRSEDGDDQTV